MAVSHIQVAASSVGHATKDDNIKVTFQTLSKLSPPKPSPLTMLTDTTSTTTTAITTTATMVPTSNTAAVTVSTPTEESFDQYDDSDIDAPLGKWVGATRETLQEGQIIKSGYLMKKGERLKIWKKRWFVLRTSKLAYYKDDKEYELLRIVDLRDIHRAAAMPIKHKPGTFIILTPQRTFSVQATDILEMQDWINAISEAKIQFEFMASNSDLESYSESTVHLEQSPQLSTIQEGQQQQQQQHSTSQMANKLHLTSSPTASTATPSRNSVTGMILPKWQLQRPLSLLDPDLLDGKEKPHAKGKSVAVPSSSGVTTSSSVGTTSPQSVGSILGRPTIRTSGLRHPAEGLSLITSSGVQTKTQAQAIQISSPSSPYMEQVYSNEPPVGSLSSEQSFIGAAAAGPSIPGTPLSPVRCYSGGEMFWMASQEHNNQSSSEEDAGDDSPDPCIAEVARVASEANASASGTATDEQHESSVVIQGHLYKLSNKYKTWRKKWFVLRGDNLAYYKDTKEYQPHGIIPLSTIIDCLQTDPISKSKQYCLRIVTAKRSFICCAPDEDTLLQWLDTLHVECDRVAQIARQEDMVDFLCQQQRHNQQGSESLHDDDDDDDDDEEQAKQLGGGSRLRMNLHNPLPHRPRFRSKSGDNSGSGFFGSSANSASGGNLDSVGTQLRKVLSLDSATNTVPASVMVSTSETGSGSMNRRASAAGAPSVTFQIPVIAPL
ncbi:hypothetical protein BX616_008997 [Lobosporangium transversale]|uniref:PH domain-containing protein n=1 Tax=Lobosporangium transversale TaxID=64571 RepID=A0A1Y2GF31_9FUNG|nr:hypothetical protein BCR41DRAFT_358844 [Lobosporangium transversale]KAF9914089.1 hypothetical protein BX616_008997 [Lobosporangium transversale]ORZ09078.1 hypothetical protein BCR41DRAFT_358844 [Lobosporangium transversale]|eukprot:XP_021878705.1 hypothetical protein BCR41DRAFT_358844 [Lobosporangium transversale]